MYPPIVHSGTRLIGPASEKTNGSEEITLLPKEDFTHRTTPNVIRYNEIRSRRCCQRNDIAFSFRSVVRIIFMFDYLLAKLLYFIDSIRLLVGYCKVGTIIYIVKYSLRDMLFSLTTISIVAY